MLTESGKLAIAELVFYTPVLFLAAIVNIRHGFSKNLGWVYLVSLALVRIVGWILELISMNNASAGLVVAVVMLRTTEPPSIVVFHPVYSSFYTYHRRFYPAHSWRIGVERSKEQPTPPRTNSALAAIILLIVDFAALSGITLLYYLPQLRIISQGEKPILIAVAASTPFLLARLMYSTLVYFDTNTSAFSPITGNVIIRSFMATFEEFTTVGLYLAAGLLALTIPQGDYQRHKPLNNNQYELDHLTAGRSS